MPKEPGFQLAEIHWLPGSNIFLTKRKSDFNLSTAILEYAHLTFYATTQDFFINRVPIFTVHTHKQNSL